MDGDIMSSGFYTLSGNGQLVHAPSGIATPTGRYVKDGRGSYTYPIDGKWYWFESEADALAHYTTMFGDIPSSVTMFQARAALINAGLFDAVDTVIHDGDDLLAQTAWEYAATIERQSPLMKALASKLGLNDAQIDQLFRTAARIKV